MELRVLKYYVTIVQEGNISRASNVLHISQSTLSRQIQELETELNAKLFDRGKREIKLTENGQLLYSRALEMLQIAQNTSKTIRSGEIVAGELHVGVGENYMSQIVSHVFKELLDRFPDIKVHLHNIPSDIIPHQIDEGILDFGFAVSQQNLDDYYQLEFPIKNHWGILMPQDHELASLKNIHPQDLINQRVILGRQRGLFERFNKWLGHYEVRQAGTYDMTESMHMMVKAGVGLAVTFDKTKYHRSGFPLVFREFANFDTSHSKLIWRKDRHQTAIEKYFLEFMREQNSKLRS